jgi:hypothetical protein
MRNAPRTVSTRSSPLNHLCQRSESSSLRPVRA